MTTTAIDTTRFIGALFNDDDLIELRLIKPGEKRVLQRWCPAADVSQHFEWCRQHNAAGYGIYIGANPRKREGGRAEDVALARSVFIDFDGVSLDDARRRVDEVDLPIPTIITSTGHPRGGYHFWWRLDEPLIDLDRWHRIQTAVIKAVDSDPAIHDKPRVMRLPGFMNTKYEAKPEATIVECDGGRTYALGEFPETEQAEQRAAGDDDSGNHKPGLADVSTLARAAAYAKKWKAVQQGNRDGSAYRHAAVLTREFALSDDEAWPILQAWNRLNDPPMELDELRDKLKNARQYGKNVIGSKLTAPASAAPKENQAPTLIKIAEAADLFHDASGEPWSTVAEGSHQETHHVQHRGFRRWLVRRFYLAEGKPPSAQAMQDALTFIAARAIFDGPECEVPVRLDGHDNAIYIDLGDADWRVVRVDATGWQICNESPVRFRRPAGMLSLPDPVTGGSLEDLQPFANVQDESDFILLVSFMVAALRPTGPYPILIVDGEQGSAKSTTCRIVRSLIDPNVSPLRSTPREDRDLLISARNGWVVAYDNVTNLPGWLSDALCRLATGGGFSTRMLYSDSDENIIDAQRPTILNGISNVGERADLLDRAISITLPSIPEDRRRTEREFRAAFDAARPKVFGALLTAASTGLKNIDSVKLAIIPRMADFAEWVVACEPALPWKPGRFLEAYTEARAAAVTVAIEADIVGPIFVSWFNEISGDWLGTLTGLLNLLTTKAGDQVVGRSRSGWPTKPRALSAALRRLAPNLRQIGIHIDFDAGREPGSGRTRIQIRQEKVSTTDPDCERGREHCERSGDAAEPDVHTENGLLDTENGDCERCERSEREIPTHSIRSDDQQVCPNTSIPGGWDIG